MEVHHICNLPFSHFIIIWDTLRLKEWIQGSLLQILNHLMALTSIFYPPKLGYLGNPRSPKSVLHWLNEESEPLV